MADQKEVSVGCGGCLSLIIFVIIIWALLFGVTINGKHYGLSCSGDKGIEVK